MCLGIPGLILETHGEDPVTRVGKVNFNGITKTVNLAYTPEAKCGDYVIVHVGFAISIVNQEEANKVFNTLKQLNLLEQER
ncbi:HypC/HybG/HupF family hydrogenase formation chaperone [Candidatus Nomurabacteria bacterium]|nr:HypC/HybG/HupF family hydrogenase formation chaperone [Candidatus Nomurabacteria bacterium]